jgi:hypothetical protein
VIGAKIAASKRVIGDLLFFFQDGKNGSTQEKAAPVVAES